MIEFENQTYAIDPLVEKPGGLTTGVNFCMQLSTQCEELIDEHWGDPRMALGARALFEAGPQAETGWKPAWDARDLNQGLRG